MNVTLAEIIRETRRWAANAESVGETEMASLAIRGADLLQQALDLYNKA